MGFGPYGVLSDITCSGKTGNTCEMRDVIFSHYQQRNGMIVFWVIVEPVCRLKGMKFSL